MRMPGEFERHDGCFMVWPTRPGSWTNSGKDVQPVFVKIASAIAESETLYMCTDDEHRDEAEKTFEGVDNVKVVTVPTNDAWARDIGPTIVYGEGNIRIGNDWCFNAWGGEVDGLYADWDQDDAAASLMCEAIGIDVSNQKDFVLEGGSIHVDGEGTLITTEACLLSEGRNPNLSKAEIENRLKDTLGVSKIIWLPNGILGDETNEHVDNFCAFVKPGEVVIAWTDDRNDPQYEACQKAMDVLNNETDAMGRKLIIHKLPVPKNPVLVREEDLEGLDFAEGEDNREVGEKLAASYVNFYISNGGIIVPQFGDPNDEVATEILKDLFPNRKIYPIDARMVIVGGGNIHCITQQIPKEIK